MNDVIAESPLQYVHADLVHYGYIYIHEGYDTTDFHRDMTLDQFPEADTYDSLAEAVQELPSYDGETFVMAFEKESGHCDRLWFTELQAQADLPKRLERYRMCYGGYGTSIFKGTK